MDLRHPEHAKVISLHLFTHLPRSLCQTASRRSDLSPGRRTGFARRPGSAHAPLAMIMQRGAPFARKDAPLCMITLGGGWATGGWATGGWATGGWATGGWATGDWATGAQRGEAARRTGRCPTPRSRCATGRLRRSSRATLSPRGGSRPSKKTASRPSRPRAHQVR